MDDQDIANKLLRLFHNIHSGDSAFRELEEAVLIDVADSLLNVTSYEDLRYYLEGTDTDDTFIYCQ